MDAGSLIKVFGTTVVVVAAGVGVKLAVDYIRKDIELDMKADALCSKEYENEKKKAIELTQQCRDIRSSNDEFEGYLDVLKDKYLKASYSLKKPKVEIPQVKL